MKIKAQRQGGWPLVELIVLLLVVAVAVSLLLPALARAKFRTKRMGCTAATASAETIQHSPRNSMKTIAQRKSGFTLIEILIVVGTILLIVFVMIPMLTRRPAHDHRQTRCISNLKQIGLGFRLFSNDHNDAFPFAVSRTEGGTRELTNSSQVFLHFQALSNELVTPKVLVCPMDAKRRRASDFLNTANTNSFNSNSNLSYFVGLDGDESKRERLLSGDRNITGGILTNGFLRLLKTNSLAGWTKDLHDYGGNLGLSDGSVAQMTAQDLQRQLRTNTLQTIRLAIP